MSLKKIKFVLPLAALLFLSTSSFAQLSGGTSFGVTGGLNMTDLRYFLENREGNNSRLLTSFNVGVVADYAASEWVSFQTGAMFTGKGATIEGGGNGEDFNYRMHPWYIEIPLHLIIKPNNVGQNAGFYFGAGPYVAFAVGGKGDYSGPSALSTDYYRDHKLKFGSKSSKDMKGVDFGLNFLAGVSFGHGLMLGARYGLGITNLAPSDNQAAPTFIKNRMFSVTLTVLFKNDSYYYY